MGILKQKGGKFTLSQVRLICKQKEDAKKPFAGKGINVYPIGYLKTPELLEIKRLNEPIEMGRDSFTAGQMVTDFAFWVPGNFVPVLVEFKQNNIAQVPAVVRSRAACYFTIRGASAERISSNIAKEIAGVANSMSLGSRRKRIYRSERRALSCRLELAM